MSIVTVAATQMACSWDRDANVARAEKLIREAAAHDLTVLGVGEGWQLEPHVFGLRSERLAAQCPSSLLVVRGHAEQRASAA